LYSVKGKELLTLAADKDDAPSLYMHDLAGKQRLTMAVYKGSGPDLSMFDSTGKERASMGVFKDDPYLRIVKSEEYIWGAP